eukprot:TRINITY_DN210_c0_g1_i2.p1 TRINITY_DN210_c0_g1~~TRINITY_DN210_c0_g1_i2.p1  ORF type:complete len:1092 (+),score=243.08 TRINITY_DN210_c0_g1_i2:396-3278(+)
MGSHDFDTLATTLYAKGASLLNLEFGTNVTSSEHNISIESESSSSSDNEEENDEITNDDNIRRRSLQKDFNKHKRSLQEFAGEIKTYKGLDFDRNNPFALYDVVGYNMETGKCIFDLRYMHTTGLPINSSEMLCFGRETFGDVFVYAPLSLLLTYGYPPAMSIGFSVTTTGVYKGVGYYDTITIEDTPILVVSSFNYVDDILIPPTERVYIQYNDAEIQQRADALLVPCVNFILGSPNFDVMLENFISDGHCYLDPLGAWLFDQYGVCIANSEFPEFVGLTWVQILEQFQSTKSIASSYKNFNEVMLDNPNKQLFYFPSTLDPNERTRRLAMGQSFSLKWNRYYVFTSFEYNEPPPTCADGCPNGAFCEEMEQRYCECQSDHIKIEETIANEMTTFSCEPILAIEEATDLVIIVSYILFVCSFGTALFIACVFFWHRKTLLVRLSSHVFCQGVFVSVMLSSIAALFFAIRPTASNNICELRIVLITVGATGIMTFLFTKTYRMARFINNAKLRKMNLNTSRLMKMAFGLMLPVILLHVIMFYIQSPKFELIHEDIVEGSYNNIATPQCTYFGPSVATIMFYMFLLALWGTSEAYSARFAPLASNETEAIFFNMFVLLLTFVVTVPVFLLIQDDITPQIFLRSVVVNALLIVMMLSIFGQKVMWLLIGEGNNPSLRANVKPVTKRTNVSMSTAAIYVPKNKKNTNENNKYKYNNKIGPTPLDSSSSDDDSSISSRRKSIPPEPLELLVKSTPKMSILKKGVSSRHNGIRFISKLASGDNTSNNNFSLSARSNTTNQSQFSSFSVEPNYTPIVLDEEHNNNGHECSDITDSDSQLNNNNNNTRNIGSSSSQSQPNSKTSLRNINFPSSSSLIDSGIPSSCEDNNPIESLRETANRNGFSKSLLNGSDANSGQPLLMATRHQQNIPTEVAGEDDYIFFQPPNDVNNFVTCNRKFNSLGGFFSR